MKNKKLTFTENEFKVLTGLILNMDGTSITKYFNLGYGYAYNCISRFEHNGLITKVKNGLSNDIKLTLKGQKAYSLLFSLKELLRGE